MSKRGLGNAFKIFTTIAFVFFLLAQAGGIKTASATDLTVIVFDDMEHGDPWGNGWFAFGGSVGGGGIGPNATDLPPINGGSFSIETGWGSGGVPGYFGGFGRTNPIDLTGADHFNFWINPNAGQDYTLEINLQEDDNGDNAISQPDDDEFQFNCVISPTGPCAVSGAGWQYVSIPLADFFDDGSYLWGGNGVLDPVSDSNGGNGQLINVVVAVIGNSGSDVNFRTDYWAFSDGPMAYQLVDDFEAGVNPGTPCVGIPLGFCTFQDASSAVAVSSQMTPPAPVPEISGPNNVLQIDLDVTAYAGFIHGFTNQAGDTWTPQDWSSYGGFGFWIYGTGSNTVMFIDLLENRNPDSTTDDAERWTVEFTDNFIGWQKFEFPFTDFVRKGVGNSAPNDGYTGDEVYGWAFGTLGSGGPITYYLDQVYLFGEAAERPLEVNISSVKFEVVEGGDAVVGVKLSRPLKAGDPDQVSVSYTTEPGSATPEKDYTPTSGILTFFKDDVSQQTFTVPTFDNIKYDGNKTVILRIFDPVDIPLGSQTQSWVDILDDETYDPQLIDDFETYPYFWEVDDKVDYTNQEVSPGDAFALPGQADIEHVFEAGQKNGKGSYRFSRTFAVAQDWSSPSGVNFWYYGRGNDENVVVSLSNDRAGYTDPSKWKLIWSDEFNEAAGTAVDPAVWGQEIGDGTINGIPGWGNNELQYYTAGNANAATDGMGNLQITAKKAAGSLMCYYGPCEYTSARLLTKDRFEVAYGRVEARIKVMEGAGLWPAFWMLGADIDEVDWPQSGEIDIMEYVGRVPNEIFGTLHGPGYSGGASYGQSVDLGGPVADEFHTYAIEWQPDQITWFLDGEAFFTATPSDSYMTDKQWVFNHPFFILLNVAIGGNFGGPVGEDTTFPQSMLVDYVRLYQAKEMPVEFKTSFSENFIGWQKINLPFESFINDDGFVLDRTAIKSIGFKIPGGSGMPVMLDQIRLSCPNTVTVTNSNDSGSGSLRAAYGAVCADGLVQFAPELTGQTITLYSGPLVLNKNVTIDASAAPDLTLSGGGVDRVFIVDAGTTATLMNLKVADGYGWQLAGGILNNGSLTLDHVVVTGNTMATNAGDFWQGGGGIYSGDGATLNLIDSTVSNNLADWSGGGVYAFFNTSITVVRSTISGNVSGDVGGGIRSLGNMTITNSTISGNESTGWYGGAIFVTDGVVNMMNSTIAINTSPSWAPADVFVGTFTDASATLTLTNTIISSAQDNCFFAPWGTGVVTLTADYNNVFTDGTCFVGPTDQVVSDAGLGPLADNGGPTLTHALLAGSTAIDAADGAVCPATDQRGVARPQGAGCDVGAYEAE